MNQFVHMFEGHLLVGDFHGFRKGVTDYFTNLSQLTLFHFVFLTCHFYTQLFTFFVNDEGVAFYRCYKNFPANIVFYD
jgi:hypothetical protein